MNAESSELRASVVVPVFNRPDELRRLLEGLIQQSMEPADFEILICDDGSTSDLVSVVEAFQMELGPEVRYFRQSNQGAGAARNLGLANARGEIVAFTDSDCLVDRDWLERLIEPIEFDRAEMTGGLIDFRTADHLSGRCVNFLMSSMLGGGGARDPRSVVHMKYFPRAGNAAVRRSIALAAGGFPGHNHGEDIQFSNRMIERGARIEFVPSAKVVHNEKRSIWQVAREASRKGAARIRLARELGVHQWIHAVPAMMVMNLIASLLFTIMVPQWAMVLALPAILYCLMLLVVSMQGAIVLRDVRALFALPVYTALMHFGYGFGYLYTVIRRQQPSLSAQAAKAIVSGVVNPAPLVRIDEHSQSERVL